MKPSMILSLFTAAAFAAVALPASAAPKTHFESYTEALAQRLPDQKLKYKSGLCVCVGGDLDRRTGHIVAGLLEDAGLVSYAVVCQALFFDQETGEIDDVEQCDEGWMPLPK